MAAIWVFAGAFVASTIATGAAIPFLRRARVLDVPNQRSSHTVVTPRGGGVGILAGIACGAAIAAASGVPLLSEWFWIGIAALAVSGFADDMRRDGLPQSVRLVLQVGVAVGLVGSQGGLLSFPLPPPADFNLGVAGYPLAVLWIVGVTNIFNFLDGIDGYAAVQGLVAGLALACVAGEASASCALAAAGACGGFLIHNWHRARVFMGDVSSGVLGFTFASLPFAEQQSSGAAPLVLTVGLALWFFLSDGAYTIARRAFRGERFWAAHRTHLYQRLTQTGLRHDQVTGRVGAGMAAIAAGAVAARATSSAVSWLVLGTAVASWIWMLAWTRKRERG